MFHVILIIHVINKSTKMEMLNTSSLTAAYSMFQDLWLESGYLTVKSDPEGSG